MSYCDKHRIDLSFLQLLKILRILYGSNPQLILDDLTSIPFSRDAYFTQVLNLSVMSIVSLDLGSFFEIRNFFETF